MALRLLAQIRATGAFVAASAKTAKAEQVSRVAVAINRLQSVRTRLTNAIDQHDRQLEWGVDPEIGFVPHDAI